MTIKTLAIAAITIATLGLSTQTAIAQATGAVPANFPPQDYKGRQFVDNNGCVFVRAGFDGAVNWVPRVDRQRKQVCGQRATFGGQTAQAAPAAPQAEQITLSPAPAAAATAAATAVVKPSTVQRVPLARAAAPQSLQPASAPTPLARKVTQRSVAAASQTVRNPVVQRVTQPARVLRQPATPVAVAAPTRAPITVRAPASKPVAAQPPRVVRRVPTAAVDSSGARHVVLPNKGNPNCNGASALSNRYMNAGGDIAVRCGPQTSSHVFLKQTAPVAVTNGTRTYTQGQGHVVAGGETRIIPSHLTGIRQAARVHVPQGYRPAWNDDRLNPNRALQTVNGYYQTQQVWTNTVPRRLVAQSGKEHAIKAPVIVGTQAAQSGAYLSAKGATSSQQPVISAKSAPRKVAGAASARFVDIGVFTTEGKAAAAAARLQRAGLPVKYGVFQRNGQTYRRVLVGPFASASQLNTAANSVRGVGYTQISYR